MTGGRLLLWLVLAALLAAFLVAGLAFATHAGLSPDELLFVSAARDLGGGSQVIRPFLGIPLLIMPYIGALKSYLFFPIFRAAGISALSIRLPMLLVGIATMLTWFALARSVMSRGLAILLVALLATDPAFILPAAIDFGPNGLMLLLSALALFLSRRLRDRPSLGTLLGLLAVFCVGVFDKLNFLWLVFAVGVSLLIFDHGALRTLGGRSRLGFASVSVVFAALMALALMQARWASTTISTELRPPPAFGERSMALMRAYLDTMSGQTFFAHVAGERPGPGSPIAYALALAALSVLGAFAMRRSEDRCARFVRFLGTTGVLAFLAMSLTRHAGGPHHVMLLWPFHHAIVVGGVALAQTALAPRGWLRHLPALAVAPILIAQTLTTANQVASLKAGPHYRFEFSPEIFRLADYLDHQSASVDEILIVEWGVHPQLDALTSDATRNKMIDLWSTLFQLEEHPPSARDDLYARLLASKRVLAVFTAAGLRLTSRSRDEFLALLASHHRDLKPLRSFQLPGGRQLYGVALVP